MMAGAGDHKKGRLIAALQFPIVVDHLQVLQHYAGRSVNFFQRLTK